MYTLSNSYLLHLGKNSNAGIFILFLIELCGREGIPPDSFSGYPDFTSRTGNGCYRIYYGASQFLQPYVWTVLGITPEILHF